MFGWIIGRMAGQEVSRCASNDASTCMSMPVSVLLGLDGGLLEGGEPMMTMLRFSELPVMLAAEVTIRRDLR